MADYSLIESALQRGYSMDEIADKLAQAEGFDPSAIRARGYGAEEIIGRLGYVKPETSYVKPETSDVARGFVTSFKQLPQLGYGLLAGAGAVAESVAGEGGVSTSMKNFGVKKYQEAGADIEKDSKQSDSLSYSWEQAKQGDFGSLVDWLQYGIGYGGGQAVQALATAGVGSLVGKTVLKGTAENLASKMVAKEALRLGATEEAKRLTAQEISKIAVANVASNIGQTVAIGSQAFGMEGGEIFGDLAQKTVKEGRAATGGELAKAFGATAAAGALEFVGDKLGVDVMLGKSKMFKPASSMTGVGGRAARAAVAVPGTVLAEGGTEYLQTGIEEYGKGNEKNFLPFMQSESAQKQALDAAGLGAVGGGGMAMVGGAFSSPQKKDAAPSPSPSISSAQTADDAIAAFQDEVASVTPRGSFGNMDELAGFIEAERSDIGKRRGLLAQQQQDARDMENEFNGLVKDEQIDQSYRLNDAQKQRDAERAREGGYDLALQQREEQQGRTVEQLAAASEAQGFGNEEPTAMQLAMQQAQQKALDNEFSGLLKQERASLNEMRANVKRVAGVPVEQISTPQLEEIAQSEAHPNTKMAAVAALNDRHDAIQQERERLMQLREARLAEQSQGETNGVQPHAANGQVAARGPVGGSNHVPGGGLDAAVGNVAGSGRINANPPHVAQGSRESVSVPNADSQANVRALTENAAKRQATQLTNQGFPTVAYPHPTQPGMWAIGSHAEAKSAPAKEQQAQQAQHAPVEPAADDVPVINVRQQTPRKKPASNTIAQAIINLGGISTSLKTDILGDASIKTRPGLFTTNGTGDLGEIAAMLSSGFGFSQIDLNDPTDNSGAKQLADLIARSVNGETILNEEGMILAQQDEEFEQAKAEVNLQAQEIGIKPIRGKRTIDIVQSEINAILAEREEMSRQKQEAQRLLDEVAEQELIDAFNLQMQEYHDENAITRDDRRAESARLSAEESAQGDGDSVNQASPVAGRASPTEGGRGEAEVTPEFGLVGQTEEEAIAEEQARRDEDQRKADEDRAEKRRIDAEAVARRNEQNANTVASDNFQLGQSSQEVRRMVHSGMVDMFGNPTTEADDGNPARKMDEAARQAANISDDHANIPNMDGVRAAAQQILDAIEQDDLADYGLRVIPGEFEGDIAVGDVLPPSRVWEDGRETDDELLGTSTVEVGSLTLDGVLKSLNGLGAAGKPGPNGYYFGDRVVLVKGDRVSGGDDSGESLLKNASVVGVWRKASKGLSSILPNEAVAPKESGANTLDPVAAVKATLDAAGVTGTDRTSTIAAVRRGDLTPEDVAEAHPSPNVADSASEGKPIRPYATPDERNEAIWTLQAEAKSSGLEYSNESIKDAAEFGAPANEIAAAIDAGEDAVADLAERYAKRSNGLRQGFGQGNNDNALRENMKPPSEHEKRIASLTGRGLYELTEAQRSSLLKFAKVRSIDAFEDIAFSARREIIGQWLDMNPAETKQSATYTIAEHSETIDKLNAGTLTVEEYKAAFARAIESREALAAEFQKMTKDAIMKTARLSVHYKNDTKDRIVKAAANETVEAFDIRESSTWVIGTDRFASLRNFVEGVTQADLDAYAAKRKAKIEEYVAGRQAMREGIDNPQTLEDFRNAVQMHKHDGKTFAEARMMLTPEQRATFDELAAEESRKTRNYRADQKAVVQVAAATTEGQIVQTKHTKTGEDLFVVKAAERVERDVYNQWNATAKKLGGWYSSFRGAGAVPGFQFKTMENAEAFLKYLGGDVSEAKAAVQERRDAFADDKSQSAVERLREMAERLDEKADEALGRDRKANTARRARFAAAAESAANGDKAMAATMRNIAQAIESGSAKFLDRVRQKTQIEMLNSLVSTAQWDYWRAKYPTYSEQERHKGEPAVPEVADYARFPQYTAFRSDLAKLGRQMLEIDGAKKIGQQLLSVADDVTDAYLEFAKANLHKVSTFKHGDGQMAAFSSRDAAEKAIARSGYKGKAIVLQFKRGQNIIVQSPSFAQENGIWEGDGDKLITLNDEAGSAVVAKGKELGRKLDVPSSFGYVAEKQSRLRAMGIETPAEFRAMLREFIGMKQAPKAPDRVKELERAMAGKRNTDGLDFFPTPAGTVRAMLDAAEIEPGMSVLEPSAGMGHIADMIREDGIEPDVVEISGERRELLDAKGHNVVGSDFMEVAGEYDRILMNPPFGDRRDALHVKHAYSLLKPGGRIVAIMGEGVFFGQDKKAQQFREWLESVGGTSEKLEDGTFLDPSLPVNTGVNARLVVIDKSSSDVKITAKESRRASNDLDFTQPQGSEPLRKTSFGYANDTHNLFHVSTFKGNDGDVSTFDVHDTNTGRKLGEVALGLRGDEITTLANIEAKDKKSGFGEQLLRSLVANNPDGIYIINMLPEAVPFWQKMGVSIDEHFEGVWEHGNGVLTEEAIQTARNSERGIAAEDSGGERKESRGSEESGRGRQANNPVSSKGVANKTAPANAGVSVSAPSESVRRIQAVVERFKSQFKGATALDIRVVSTTFDIPARFRPSPFAEGVFHDDEGIIYLVTMNLRDQNGNLSERRAWQVLLHEAVGHYGLARMLGNKFAGILKAVKQATLAGRKVSETQSNPLQPGDKDYTTWEAVKLRYPDATDSEVAQEVLARMSETDPGSSIVGYAVAVVRQWVREMARAMGINLVVSTSELRDLVAKASGYMRRGDNLAEERVPIGLVAASTGVAREGGKRGLESRAATVQPQGPIWSAPEMSRTDNIIYTMQDKNIDLKRVQQAIKEAVGEIRDDIDTYLQEELFHGRAAKITEEFLDKEVNPLISLMRASNVSMEEMETFLWARHAKERNAQIAKINDEMPDGGSGLTNKQADDLMAGKDVTIGDKTIEGVKPNRKELLSNLAGRVDAITRGNRALLEHYSLESADTLNAWDGAYKHYVPLHREDAESHLAGMGTGQGYSVKGSSSKRATGSSRPVENILANLALQRERIITRGEKNRVAQSLYGLAKEMPNADLWEVDVKPTMRTTAMIGGREQVVDAVDPNFRNRPNVVFARFNGEDHFIVFNEHNERAVRMAQALKNLDADDISHLLGEVSRWTRYFASINTQYNPIFGVTNLVRDVQTGLLNLKSTPIEGKQKELMGNLTHALPAVFKALRAGRKGQAATGTWAQLWEEFQEIGGQTGYRNMFRNGQERAEALQNALDPTWWQKTWWGKAATVGGVLAVPEQAFLDKFGKPFMELLSDYNTMMENGIRLSAYKVALDSGMTKERAASLAKNLTVNFNRKGQAARQVGSLYAFFNASVQGTARMAETLNHGAKPGELLGKAGKQIVYGGLLLGAVQAMLLMAAGFDDEEPPEFVRDRNIIIPTGNGKYVSIPMPLGFHVLPAISRISIEFTAGGFKKPGEHLVHIMDVLLDSFNPIGNAGLSMQTVAPTVLDPIAALTENKDWSGRQIARQDFSKLNPTPGYTRAKDTASSLSRGLAYAFNYLSGGGEYGIGIVSPTPDQIDYLLGQLTGGVGRELGKVLTTGETMATGEDLPPHKIPLVGRFYGDTTGQSSEASKFYGTLEKLSEHRGTLDRMKDAHDLEAYREYAKEHPESRFYDRANKVQRELSSLRKLKRTMIERNADRAKVRQIEDRMRTLMTRFNQSVSEQKGDH